jgi:hypothetical protein
VTQCRRDAPRATVSATTSLHETVWREKPLRF